MRTYVVCTGGEPLLQLDRALIDALHANGFEIAVETNGTLPVPAGVDWICVSPKADAELVQTSGDELKLVFPQPLAPPERFASLDFQHRFLQPMDGPALGRPYRRRHRLLQGAPALAARLADPQDHRYPLNPSMHPDKCVDMAIRRAVDPALLLIAGAYLIAALVGLPLFGDGGYYFFKLATDGEPLLPNLRFTALLPQLPGLAAMQFTADPVLLRQVFSISYQSLPWLSLAACWLLLRSRMPWLMLLPLLSLAGTLLNFSAVSELLSGLYLVWPLVLAMALAPERPWVRIYAFLSGPLLLALHPMAFVLAFALAAAAGFIAWRAPDLRRVWRRLAIWIGLNGLIRLVWTLVGANAYERTNLTDTGMAHYLLPETAMQQLLLARVGLCVACGRRRAAAPITDLDFASPCAGGLDAWVRVRTAADRVDWRIGRVPAGAGHQAQGRADLRRRRVADGAGFSRRLAEPFGYHNRCDASPSGRAAVSSRRCGDSDPGAGEIRCLVDRDARVAGRHR